MSYSLDKIYNTVGRDDKVALLYFYPESDAFRLYGTDITVSFIYSANEREKFEARFNAGLDEGLTGPAKAKYLVGYDLSDELKQKLLVDGIDSSQIMSISPGFWSHENLYHEEKIRTVRKMNIPIRSLPKGGDNDWIYGMKKRFIADGIGLSPYDREWYLALKKFYEEDKLTPDELNEISDGGALKPGVEKKYLEIKLGKEVITEEEEKQYDTLLFRMGDDNLAVLKDELSQAGTSLEKLYMENRPLFNHLVAGVVKFIPTTLNFGKRAIFRDWRSYLHIHLRHVKEFQISANYANKDKLLWTPDNIDHVMERVIEQINDEVQKYWETKPNNRYSKYGDQSVYYEGDYYTVHIEASGRVSTFHRNEKRI